MLETRMPKVAFTKMNGAGNDFVMLDNRGGDVRLDATTIARLCDRHRGIGCRWHSRFGTGEQWRDFRMRYYNADGGEAEMCGNGARCFARFADRVTGPLQKLSFETPAGVIAAALEGEAVTLQMSDPKDLRLALDISAAGKNFRVHYIDSGVPHVDPDGWSRAWMCALSSAIAYTPNSAPRGANVNFLEKRGADQIAIRTYERGVENETLACGTGVVASALIFAATENATSPVRVLVKGGDELRVGFTKSGDRFTNVTLSGPAEFAFEGTVEL